MAGDGPMIPTDPMDKLVFTALLYGGYTFRWGENTVSKLDFEVDTPEGVVAIEVKQFHSDRIAKQMSRAENVIAVQGKRAVHMLAGLLEGAGHDPLAQITMEEETDGWKS